MDRISRLPPGIIEAILCLLPIQEAARTSILSKEWRYHWIKIPKLAFTEDTREDSSDGADLSILEPTFEKPSHRKGMTSRCKLFYAIYQALLMHQGPIHECTLLMEVDNSCVEIDHIILHLSKKNTIKVLKLDLTRRYKLPSSLFSLHQLMDLYLNDCAIDLQPSFNGFGSLTTLCLQDIWICDKALLRLLSGCPSLKRLTLMSDNRTIDDTGDLTISDLFKCLPVIEYLSIWFSLILCFGPNRFPKELPTTLIHLKYLCMQSVCFGFQYGLNFLALMVRSSPNLEKLKLEMDRDLWNIEMCFFTLEDYSDITSEHLNELKILCFSNTLNGLNFVKLILAKSPVLKKVRIFLHDTFDKVEECRVSKILLSSPCASPVVRITIR